MAKNTRILTFVSRFMGHSVAGLESQIFEEYSKISNIHPLIIITEEATSSKDNVTLIQIPKISIPKIRGINKILQYVFATIKLRKKYDLVYVRTFSIPELVSSYFSKKFLKKPLILLVPGSWILINNRIQTKILRYFFKKNLHLADKIIFYSRLMIPEIKSIIGNFDESRSIIIHNAVDPQKFFPNQSLTKQNKILYVGRIHPLKNIHDIVNAIPLVKKKIPDIQLELIGFIESENYLNLLKQKISTLNCQNNIQFLGPIPHNNIQKYYNDCSIFVLMGQNEGMPRSILEAMSSGKAVISAPNSGIPDLIKNNINGILVENNNPEKLSENIIKLLTDVELRKKIGFEARKTIEENFTWDLFINNITNEFKKF